MASVNKWQVVRVFEWTEWSVTVRVRVLVRVVVFSWALAQVEIVVSRRRKRHSVRHEKCICGKERQEKTPCLAQFTQIARVTSGSDGGDGGVRGPAERTWKCTRN